MKKLAYIPIYLIILFSGYSCFIGSRNPAPTLLKVMSFNIWVGGGKSVNETANVFLKSDADIIGVQESMKDGKNNAILIADSLGWYSYDNQRGQTVVSKYPIVDTTTNKWGVKIKVGPSHFVWMFSIHLMHCPYEPYQLNGIEYCGASLLNTADEAIQSAIDTRGESVDEIIADILSVREEGYSIFLTGDFNEPSHLDWTDAAVKAGLYKMVVEWPSTKAFLTKGGMKDSYRLQCPDEVRYPGHTWTPLPETKAYSEVLDRIDFVLFSGANIELKDSQVIGEVGDKSDIGFVDYPSDHRAVLSTFVLK